MTEFELRLLKLFEQHDIQELLYWSVIEEDVTWFVLCNDLFYWAMVEPQDITPDTIEVLEQSIKDCEEISPLTPEYGIDLYACRMEKMRPQGAAYPQGVEGNALDPLFDACGPEREVNCSNPFTPESYRNSLGIKEIS